MQEYVKEIWKYNRKMSNLPRGLCWHLNITLLTFFSITLISSIELQHHHHHSPKQHSPWLPWSNITRASSRALQPGIPYRQASLGHPVGFIWKAPKVLFTVERWNLNKCICNAKSISSIPGHHCEYFCKCAVNSGNVVYGWCTQICKSERNSIPFKCFLRDFARIFWSDISWFWKDDWQKLKVEKISTKRRDP